MPIPLARVAGVFTKPGVVSNTLLLRMDNTRDPLTDLPFAGPSRHSFDLPFGETHFLNLLRPLWLVQRKQFKMLLQVTRLPRPRRFSLDLPVALGLAAACM